MLCIKRMVNIITIEQLKNNTEEAINYVLNKNSIIISTPQGNVIIMSENDYRQYERDHFKIIYQQTKNEIVNRKK